MTDEEVTADELKLSREYPDGFWSDPRKLTATKSNPYNVANNNEIQENGNVKRRTLNEIDIWKSVKEGDIETITLALSLGFEADSVDSEGRTLLHMASLYDTANHIQLVSNLATTYPEIVNIQNQEGDSALHFAAAKLNLEAVILLLKNTAIVNLLNKKGQTPLDLSPPIRNLMLEHISTPPAWIDDELANECQICNDKFTFVNRRHHCRHCGRVICGGCSAGLLPITKFKVKEKVRLCSHCKPIIFQSNMKLT